MARRPRLVSAVVAAALVASSAAALSIGSAAAAPSAAPGGTSAGAALLRLGADGDGQLTISRDARGTVTFVGAPHGVSVDAGVSKSMSPGLAARAYVDRYGAAFGATRPGTTLVRESVKSAVAGKVVRFSQRVGGLRVIGGELAVKLRAGNELSSMLATFSDRTSRSATAPRAAVGQRAAARTARGVVARSHPGARLVVRREGRWLFDPAVFQAPNPVGARSVWRFEVTDRAGVRQMVLVDDQSGAIALDLDIINDANRVVCDLNNASVANPADCTAKSGPGGRAEGEGPTGVADANNAYDLAGATSTFYQQIGGIDLTNRLGIPGPGGAKVLASTVRLCLNGTTCPYANAFWNGRGMYYGATYASADDVVAHEMTHGITEKSSNLMYWFQSGAINESMSDVMGEILDHRNVLGGEDSTWAMGEDLPIGAIRSMSNPPAFGDPDKMTSANYWNDAPNYYDNGGVHFNSGVGNKTAYLISQGGTFNGQTITGIDTGDSGLTRTATIYLDTIQSLTSGSEYADLARVLEQSCQDLIGTAGITSAHCDNVHKATLATELRLSPPNAPQPADAPSTCPGGKKKMVLFDSEKGTAGKKFTHPKSWTRAPGVVTMPSTTERLQIEENAVSGTSSWFGINPFTQRKEALVMKKAIKIPKRQKTYLWFRHWRLFDFANTTYYDGGTVEVDDVGTKAAPVSVQKKPWVNGPKQSLKAGGGKGFGGTSDGWVSSRVDLSSFGGKSVKPRFTIRSGNGYWYYGWFLDDIRIYTCK